MAPALPNSYQSHVPHMQGTNTTFSQGVGVSPYSGQSQHTYIPSPGKNSFRERGVRYLYRPIISMLSQGAPLVTQEEWAVSIFDPYVIAPKQTRHSAGSQYESIPECVRTTVNAGACGS